MRLCACGCGEALPEPKYPSWRRNYLHNHFRRKSPVEYVVDENGCWIWQRTLTRDGYGMMGIGERRTRRSHAVYFEREYGAVPDGHEIHHVCGVRACVNPQHMEAVTRLDHRRKHQRASDKAVM